MFLNSVLGFVAFFITLRYHTLYAAPYIYPPLAFYGLDLLMRLLRYRVKDASLVPIDQNMTLVRTKTQIHLLSIRANTLLDQHTRLRRRVDSGSTRPSTSLLLRTRIRVPPSHHCERSPRHILPNLYRRFDTGSESPRRLDART